PANSFADRRIVRPKTFRYTLADNADERRVGSVARVEIAALEDRLPDAPKIPGHGHARVGCIDTARLRCGRAFAVEQHQCPRRVHWRRRHDRGGFHSGHYLQLRERSFEGALFRRGGGKESIGNGDVESDAAFRPEAPWLVDQLPEISSRADA